MLLLQMFLLLSTLRCVGGGDGREQWYWCGGERKKKEGA